MKRGDKVYFWHDSICGRRIRKMGVIAANNTDHYLVTVGRKGQMLAVPKDQVSKSKEALI